MRVIAIGATGFFGRHFVRELVEAGHVPAREDAWSPDIAVDMMLGSAAQARATVETFRGIARRLVAVSSGDVAHRLDAGPLEPVPSTENSPLRTQRQTSSARRFPVIDEEYDKVGVEQAIGSDPELPATILRLPMVYGPGDPLHRLYPIVKRMQDDRSTILLERSFARWAPCRGHVQNVAHAIALAGQHRKAPQAGCITSRRRIRATKPSGRLRSARSPAGVAA